MNRHEFTLGWVMRHHVTTMLASVVVLSATIHFYGFVPKGFIPSEDMGENFNNTEGAQGVSFEQMVNNQQQLAAIVAKDPNVRVIFFQRRHRRCGTDRQYRRIFMKLKPREQRKLSADELIREMRPKLSGVQIAFPCKIRRSSALAAG